MMNKFKKIAALLTSILVVSVFSACSNGAIEYESTQKFEFHFYPEEYEVEYNTVSKTLSLEADTDYRLQLEADCDSGTMEIRILSANADVKVFPVSSSAPCSESLEIPANTATEITITVSIMPDTKGKIIGDLLLPIK